MSMEQRRVLLCVCIALLMRCYASSDDDECSRCFEPWCRCPSTEIPGGLSTTETPAVVLFTFSGSVDADFYRLLNETFPYHPSWTRRNPNGCPMSTTVFVRGSKTDYCAANRVYAQGHEMAIEGNEVNTNDRWRHADGDAHTEQIARVKFDLMEQADVAKEDIHGTRNIHLVPVNNYYTGVERTELEYDSTIRISLEEGDTSDEPATFPFTMDNKVRKPLNCHGEICPDEHGAWIWQVPILQLHRGNVSFTHVTSMPNIQNITSNELFALLRQNFYNYFNVSRVPLMINFDIAFLKQYNPIVNITGALNLFLDDLVHARDDVWILGIHQFLSWMREPASLDQLYQYQPWKCTSRSIKDCDPEGLNPEEDVMNANRTQDTEKTFESLNINALFPEGWYLVYWQTGLLLGAYFIILAYDKYGDT